MNLKELSNPFPADDIEWRVQRSGMKNGKPWAMVLAYVTSRATMDRLDAVCGPENWCNVFETGPSGGVLCGISIKIDGEWVTKWDGAENTDIESIKGGLSGAMKRAAVQWGIGRYLYRLEAGFANFHDGGKHRDYIKTSRDSKDGAMYRWDPPALPAWALPEGTGPTVDPKKELFARSKACAYSGYLTDGEVNMYREEVKNASSIDDLRKVVEEMETATKQGKERTAYKDKEPVQDAKVGTELDAEADKAFGTPDEKELF